eukprot:TRINITY_DN71302_c0_g1_i1.p1 TRINITY_DN71302_c0_g1~~TRINITY_DN71302_c0_g1_i1.p1  ORF type:complete len:444 (+),score=165.95 TRINITY_DN71302_c0_g1_i1:74-1333(+)
MAAFGAGRRAAASVLRRRPCSVPSRGAAVAAPGPLQLVECPRDAMQGLPHFVETQDKIRYINQLLKVGFHTIDFGSFVSAPAVPQMRDTADVLAGLDLSNTKSELLVIVCNVRGAEEAAAHKPIKYLGFPLSVSETFQKRNTKKDIPAAFDTLQKIQAICKQSGKELVTYISMGFGNPYKDPYDPGIVADFVKRVVDLGCTTVSLADTVGCSEPGLITELFSTLVPRYPGITIGSHFHSEPGTALAKVSAALAAGCQRFDGAIGGMGGCPFAKSSLVGNVATECIVSHLSDVGVDTGLNMKEFLSAQAVKHELFGVAVSELLLKCYLGDTAGFEALCRKSFDSADTGGDGHLSREEFATSVRRVFDELGEAAPDDDKLQKLFAEADTKGDDRIWFDEYHRIAREKLLKRMAAMQGGSHF